MGIFSNIFHSTSGFQRVSFFRALLYTFIPLGPIFMRVIDLKGSGSLIYTLPFVSFPLSLMQTVPAFFGFMKPGNGGSPIDKYMLFGLLAKLVLEIMYARGGKFLKMIPLLSYKSKPTTFVILEMVIIILFVMLGNHFRQKKHQKKQIVIILKTE